MPNNSGNNALKMVGPVLFSTGRLSELLDSRSMVAFSETCRAARDLSAETRKKHALKSLLTAVVEGNEALVMKITTSRPELLLESSAIVTDLSGKEIKGLTPLQAAICAGDVDMVQMMVDVLQQKQRGIKLSFEPEFEIQRQFEQLYPRGIDSVIAEQKTKAQQFKVSMLRDIFNVINIATPEQVTFELENPGENTTDSPLNVALHNFRAQFADLSNQDLIFNPFYLLMAFELHNEGFDNFNDLSRRDLFWLQVIGYIQRHLPACYLQAFAQGIYNIVENGEKLRREFEFRHGKGFYMRPVADLNSLGYKYVTRMLGVCEWQASRVVLTEPPTYFQELLRTKKSGLENLSTRRVAGRDSRSDPMSRFVIG